MNEKSVADYIATLVQQQPEILGSQLGSKVKQAFPQFQGLKGFIERNCGGQVVIVRRYGPDFVYAHVSQLGLGVPAPVSPPSTALRYETNPEAAAPTTTPASTALSAPAAPEPRVGDRIGFIQLPPNPARTRDKAGFSRSSGSAFRPATVWAAFTNPT